MPFRSLGVAIAMGRAITAVAAASILNGSTNYSANCQS